MKDKSKNRWIRVKTNVSHRLFSGMLVLVPVGVTLLVMRWLFRWAAGFLDPIVRKAFSGPARIPVIQQIPAGYVNVCVSLLAIILLLLLLYLVGAIGQYVMGRKLISAWERLWLRIPLIRSIYGSTKQVMQAVSLPNRSVFKSVVLVEFPRPGFRAIGFLTGRIKDSNYSEFCKVFIPTAPNVTTGFFELVPTNEIEPISMNVEEAFKMIISGGIVSPERLMRQIDIDNKIQESPPAPE